MNLGNMSDWSVVIGILIATGTIAVAIWRLARAANALELSMTVLSDAQKGLAGKLEEHLRTFSAHQVEQSTALNELRMAVEKLTWEIDRMKEKV